MIKRETGLLLCCVAHPDDESFGFGGTLAIASKYREVTIATVTSGEAGGTNGQCDASKLGVTRENELIHAAKILGIENSHVTFGHLPDGGLATEEKLDLFLLNLIRTLQPKDILTMHPESTRHSDHIAVANSLLRLKFTEGNFGLLMQYLPEKFCPANSDITICVPIAEVKAQKIRAIRTHLTQQDDAERIIPRLLDYECYVLIK